MALASACMRHVLVTLSVVMAVVDAADGRRGPPQGGIKSGQSTYFGKEGDQAAPPRRRHKRGRRLDMTTPAAQWMVLTMVFLAVVIVKFSKSPPPEPKAKQVMMAKMKGAKAN